MCIKDWLAIGLLRNSQVNVFGIILYSRESQWQDKDLQKGDLPLTRLEY